MQRKIFLFILFVAVSFACEAQVPQALNYQAIARTSNGSIIPSQNVGIRFSIKEGSVTGTTLYQETHQATTNQFGLFMLQIGTGTPTGNDFSSIDWGAISDKFLLVEIDAQGGSNYQIQGGTQLISVPYALYAEKTKLIGGSGISISNGNTISANYQAGNAINITGSMISAAYQAGNGINITGSTISSALQAGPGININNNVISAAGSSYQAGNAISITGNIISGAYQAGDGIDITGSTISSALQAGSGIDITNNVISAVSPPYQAGNAISIAGNIISGNYQAGNGINISGSTISSALVAGTGISITGNTISSTAALQWTPDANGIHYNSGNVGVGITSKPNVRFSIMGDNSHSYTAEINSTNTWQTALNIYNSASTHRWALVVGGSANLQPLEGVGNGNFGIANDNTSSLNTTYPIIISTDDKVGIGMGGGGSTRAPKAQLHVMSGDVYIEEVGAGVIMKSPNGNCWRMTVSDTGTPVFTSITCP